jgi:alpha-L-fucosidase 2
VEEGAGSPGSGATPANPDEPERPVAAPSPFVLEYHAPARSWEREALPIGNGTLGAMVLGPPEHAELVFNVGSLWTGNDNPSGAFDDTGFGAYQAFGTLHLELEGVAGARHFVRRLNLRSALHERSFTAPDGTRYVEEALASAPAGAIALRLRADGPGTLHGSVQLTGAHGETTGTAPPRRLELRGALPNGLEYAATVSVVADGSVAVADGRLRFSGCRTLTLFLAADTSYALDPKTAFRGPSPGPRVALRLEQAESTGFERIRAEHQEDHGRLFGRVDVDFGRSPEATRHRTIDRRLEAYEPGGDPELLATLFHYGRYLLLGSSRPGGLPANLQGIWNDANTPPWHSDYHSNINLQMNYWLAEPANLPECHRPLFDLLDATLEETRTATRASFGAGVPGFTYRTSHNPFGGQGWEWNTPASAWYALHYFEHYAFGGDRDFLARRAWPYLREVCEFWLHRLKRRTDGALVAPEGWSPEHGPREDGVTYDQELVWELFSAALSAAQALGDKGPLVRRIADARSRLLGPKVGRWGQLMEWVEDRDDPDDHHRHTSHLVGVYPGHHVSAARTPELAKAAEVSLRARSDTGDSRRSWTWPWRCALWARLRTPDCHRMLDGYVTHNLLPNLIATHPPLQLDGSYGITAGIAEMLLQSHAGEVDLLPGVDLTRWPSGSFRGLRARGGFEVSLSWKDGKLASVELLSTRGGPLELRSSPLPARVEDEGGATVPLRRTVRSTVSFGTKRDARYRLRFD